VGPRGLARLGDHAREGRAGRRRGDRGARLRRQGLWQGRSGADGLARIPSLPRDADLPICRDPANEGDDYDPYRDFAGARALGSLTSGLFVTARRGDDLGFVHSSWNDGIETFRWNLPSEPWQGPYVAHTVLARALLRAGDTAYMKHVFPQRDDRRLRARAPRRPADSPGRAPCR
jgi:hypothetical protein